MRKARLEHAQSRLFFFFLPSFLRAVCELAHLVPHRIKKTANTSAALTCAILRRQKRQQHARECPSVSDL